MSRAPARNETEGADENAECLTYALRCEKMAQAAHEDVDRRCLLHVASVWRGLAKLDLPRAPIVEPLYLPPMGLKRGQR